MDERPDNLGQHRGICWPHIARCLAASDHSFEHSKRALGRGTSRFAALTEHYLIIGAPLFRKPKICHTHGVQPDSKTFFGVAVAGRFERIGEFSESGFADRVEEFGLVRKMPVRRRSRHAGTVANIAQRQAANSLFFDKLSSFCDENLAKISMVIFDCHKTIIAKDVDSVYIIC
jgi:hypothetical protein